jgi:hypothetical protein
MFHPNAAKLPNTTLLSAGTAEKAINETAGQSFNPATVRGQKSYP